MFILIIVGSSNIRQENYINFKSKKRTLKSSYDGHGQGTYSILAVSFLIFQWKNTKNILAHGRFKR